LKRNWSIAETPYPKKLRHLPNCSATQRRSLLRSNYRPPIRLTHAGTARSARGDRISVKAIWHIVKDSAKKADIPNLAPHDLRRTCARLCQTAGGELEQIQFLLGHVSIQTTERYLGSKQRIRCAVNDHIGIEPDFESGSPPQM